MRRPTILILALLAVLSIGWLSSSGIWKRSKHRFIPNEPGIQAFDKTIYNKARSKAKEAATFAKEKKYNQSICFLVDMSVGSNQNRFFVYDLIRDTLQNAGLVTHGRCNENWLEGRKYGNTVGCGCSSLGKYKIGIAYNGRFGLAFKLHGLDKTNDKAYARFVVLHSHSCVPETEVTDEICQSDGCPTVSPGFLQQLKPIIQESKRPILLWIYE